MTRRRAFTKAIMREAWERSGGKCAVAGCEKPRFRRAYCSMHYSRLLRTGSVHERKRRAGGEGLEWLRANAGFHDDECLIFPFKRSTGGYGRVTLDGVRMGAHRAMCIIVHGEPKSSKMEAAHSCGMGHIGCVNPRHIRWATRAENIADRVEHGVHNRGERHGNSALTRCDVRQIRAACDQGQPRKQIARKFSIAESTVGKIARRQAWGWLHDE